jgi:type VI secretion system protein ImpE
MTDKPRPSAAAAFWEEGRLQDAIAAAVDSVRAEPTNAAARRFLCELLCFSGELDRAERQLEILAAQDPESTVYTVVSRGLIAAERARRALYDDAVVPTLLGEMTATIAARLQALVLLRDTASNLAIPTAEASAHSGVCDGQEFSEFRDLDDINAGILEFATVEGRHVWVDIDQVSRLVLQPPKRPRDLCWRPSQLTLKNTRSIEAYMPMLYANSHLAADDALRLGRATDWKASDRGPVRGIGLRTFLVGETDRTALQIGEIQMAA